MSELAPPKVFISYSWSSQEHQDEVRELAEKLVGNGVDVILDIWEVKEGHDLISFMEKMVLDTSVQKVLIICDRGYAQKANSRKGGVGTESQIISPEIYNKVEQSKFIPVVFERDEENKEYLPVFLKSRLYIDFSSIQNRYENYDKLIRAIFNQPLHKKPALGKPPSHLSSEAAARPSTKYHFERVKDALIAGKTQASALVRDYLRQKAAELDSYRVDLQDFSLGFDDLIIDSITSTIPYRDEIVDLFALIVNYKNDPDSYEELAEYFQSALSYYLQPQGTRSWIPVAADNFKFLVYELFLYFVATMIKAKRFDEANQFLSREFYIANPCGSDRFWDFRRIQSHIKSLEIHRKQRLAINRISLTADLVKERAGREDIGFVELSEADMVLYLRSYLGEHSACAWYPLTAIYRELAGGPPKLFRMSESSKHFSSLKTILGVDPRETGSSLLQRYVDNGGKTDLIFNARSFPISIYNIVDFNKLGTRP